MYKLSVVIPVYNAEDTIKMTINSILNQNWKGNITEDIEIICVDDNSTDSSLKIIKEFEAKYPNIKSYSYNQNSGFAGRGRNKGVEMSTSDFIVYSDSDDEYLPNGLNDLYNAIIDSDVDLVISSWKSDASVADNNIKMCPKKYSEDRVYDTTKISTVEKIFGIIAIAPWGKIFRKSFLINNNIKFIENANFEDVEYSFQCLLLSEKVKLLPETPTYMYYTYEDSMVHKHKPREFYSYAYVLKLMSDSLKAKGFSDENIIKDHFEILYVLFFNVDCSKEEKKEIFDELVLLHKKYPYAEINSFPLTLIEKSIKNNNFKSAYTISRLLKTAYNNKLVIQGFRAFRTLKRNRK